MSFSIQGHDAFQGGQNHLHSQHPAWTAQQNLPATSISPASGSFVNPEGEPQNMMQDNINTLSGYTNHGTTWADFQAQGFNQPNAAIPAAIPEEEDEEEATEHIGYILILKPETGRKKVKEATYLLQTLMVVPGSNRNGYKFLGYLMHAGPMIYPLYCLSQTFLTLTPRARRDRIDGVSFLGTLTIPDGISGFHPPEDLYMLATRAGPVEGIDLSLDGGTWILMEPQCLFEMILTPKSRKRGNSTFSTNSHEGIPEERSINSRKLVENPTQGPLYSDGGPQPTDHHLSHVVISENQNQNTIYYDDTRSYNNHGAGFASSSIDNSFLTGFDQPVFADPYAYSGVGTTHNRQFAGVAGLQNYHHRNDQASGYYVGSSSNVLDGQDNLGGGGHAGIGVEHGVQFGRGGPGHLSGGYAAPGVGYGTQPVEHGTYHSNPITGYADLPHNTWDDGNNEHNHRGTYTTAGAQYGTQSTGGDPIVGGADLTHIPEDGNNEQNYRDTDTTAGAVYGEHNYRGTYTTAGAQYGTQPTGGDTIVGGADLTHIPEDGSNEQNYRDTDTTAGAVYGEQHIGGYAGLPYNTRDGHGEQNDRGARGHNYHDELNHLGGGSVDAGMEYEAQRMDQRESVRGASHVDLARSHNLPDRHHTREHGMQSGEHADHTGAASNQANPDSNTPLGSTIPNYGENNQPGNSKPAGKGKKKKGKKSQEPISLEEKIARTIDLYARKEVFIHVEAPAGAPEIPEPIPTTHFSPVGVTALMKAEELWGVALERCGLDEADFEDAKPNILQKAADKINNVFFRYKESARWYVEGSTDYGGYRLTYDRSDYDLYVDANALLKGDRFLYAKGLNGEPGTVKFSHGCLHQMTHRCTGETIKVNSHPEGKTGQKLSDYHNEPALKRGSIMPMRAIVVVAGLFHDLISGFVYPYLDGLTKEARELLLPNTHPSASAAYARDHQKDTKGKAKESDNGAPGYYAGVKRDVYTASLVEWRAQLTELHTLWNTKAAEKPCTKENKPTKPGKRADKRGVRKQTAYRVSQPGPSK